MRTYTLLKRSEITIRTLIYTQTINKIILKIIILQSYSSRDRFLL